MDPFRVAHPVLDCSHGNAYVVYSGIAQCINLSEKRCPYRVVTLSYSTADEKIFRRVSRREFRVSYVHG